jgi:hypothetical protein
MNNCEATSPELFISFILIMNQLLTFVFLYYQVIFGVYESILLIF